MKYSRSLLLIALAATAGSASAQSIPGAVLAKREPHHHQTYEDSDMRVLRVRVPAHDTTLLHEHDPDYFWIALGASEVVNAKLGAPDATIKSQDLSIHYTPGKFAHVARNPGAVPFDNITVELLRPQGTVRNYCEPAMAAQPLSCKSPEQSIARGITERPAFATNALEVGLLTMQPGAVLAPPAGVRHWFIALDTADARALHLVSAKWIGGVLRAQGTGWSMRNDNKQPVKMLIVVARRSR